MEKIRQEWDYISYIGIQLDNLTKKADGSLRSHALIELRGMVKLLQHFVSINPSNRSKKSYSTEKNENIRLLAELRDKIKLINSELGSEEYFQDFQSSLE